MTPTIWRCSQAFVMIRHAWIREMGASAFRPLENMKGLPPFLCWKRIVRASTALGCSVTVFLFFVFFSINAKRFLKVFLWKSYRSSQRSRRRSEILSAVCTPRTTITWFRNCPLRRKKLESARSSSLLRIGSVVDIDKTPFRIKIVL